MKDSFFDSLARFMTVFVLLVIAAIGIALCYPIYRTNRSLTQRERELDARIERKRAEIAHLSECQRRFKSDPDFIERIARQNHRVFPGEFVFLFDE